jgi:hypothetical protein
MGAVLFWRGGAGNFSSATSCDAYYPYTDDPSGYGVANQPPSAADDTEADTACSRDCRKVGGHAAMAIVG